MGLVVFIDDGDGAESESYNITLPYSWTGANADASRIGSATIQMSFTNFAPQMKEPETQLTVNSSVAVTLKSSVLAFQRTDVRYRIVKFPKFGTLYQVRG